MNKTKIHFFSIGNGDAIMIQTASSNILIDAGKERNKMRYNKMRNEVISLLNNGDNNNIDLAIITHSDDDHIGGFLNMAADDKIAPLIKKYIFHSEKNISNYLKEEYLNKEKYPINASSNGTVKSSYRQDLELTKLLQGSRKWDEKIHLAGDKIECNEITLTVLSPTIKKLKLLHDYWKIKKEEYSKKDGTVKSSSQKCTFDYDNKFNDFDFYSIELTEDNSPVNGASIAFVYEDNYIKGLFLSDAHPSVIVQSLKTHVQVDNDPIKFDFVKLSHHASKNNLTQELLDIIDCKNFIINANANNTHCHPNKQTLAMIIQHYGEANVKFFFSEENPQLKKIFSNEDFSNVEYPNQGKNNFISREFMNNIGVKLAVRLLKEGLTIGSGVYIPLPKHDFDIIGTAKHCLCNKNPEVCKESNPDICDNCSDVEFKTLEYMNKTNAIKPLNEDPFFLNDRDVGFIKIEKQESNDITFNIHKDQIDQLLYSYGFPSGTDSEGTEIRFEIPLDLDNNSKLSLPLRSNSTSNIEDQRENLAGLSGSGVYACNGNLVGIYIGTQSIANGFAVKFDNHIISFLKGKGIDISGNIFESFTPYQEKAFEGFDNIRSHIENIAKDVIEEVSPNDILNQLGKDISYFPEFTTVEELISHLENNKNRNIRMWEGWLQLLTYLKTLQVDIKDSSDIKIKLEIDGNERKYSLEIKVNLLFTEKSSYETSVDYIHRKFQREKSSNACIVFRSDSDQKERKIFNAQKEIIENVAGINPLEPPRFNIGTIGLSRISDVVINENKMNQVRVELKKCFQDAIK